MSRKFNFDQSLLNKIFEKHKEGYSYKWLIDTYRLPISEVTLNRYYERYLLHGVEHVHRKKPNQRYSKAFKERVVQEYLDGKGSILWLSMIYHIPSDTTLRNWILRYTSGNEMKDYLAKSEVYTMKSRKTTQDERIRITEECIDHHFDYKEIAEKHQVTYNQVYQWVKKYKEHGPAGLADGRGRGKPSSIQTDAEKLEMEIKALKARNQWLEMENEVLKKAQEIEEEMMRTAYGKKRPTKRSSR